MINVGRDVRCSADFVEGKAQELTYKLQSLKGVWVARRDQSNISLCTTRVWSWPSIALWNTQRDWKQVSQQNPVFPCAVLRSSVACQCVYFDLAVQFKNKEIFPTFSFSVAHRKIGLFSYFIGRKGTCRDFEQKILNFTQILTCNSLSLCIWLVVTSYIKFGWFHWFKEATTRKTYKI